MSLLVISLCYHEIHALCNISGKCNCEYSRCRGAAMWQQMCVVAMDSQRGKRPSGRVLLYGAVAFLWERERIGNDDVIRYVYMYMYFYVWHTLC